MDEIKNIILAYCTSRDVYTAERALDDLVAKTTPENYLEIIRQIENTPGAIEFDVTIYMLELITEKDYDLSTLVHERLQQYSEQNAIEDLQEALTLLKEKFTK